MEWRDLVYLAALLVPLVVYNLALKAYDVALLPGETGLVPGLRLMRSDAFFDLGYVLFWIGLFATTTRGGPSRWVVILSFHVSGALVAAVSTIAHQYLQQTGTTLGYATLALWLPKLAEIRPILIESVPPAAWGLLAAVLLYAAFGPWLVTRLVTRVRRVLGGSGAYSPSGTSRRVASLGSLGIFLLALGFGALSMPIGTSPAGASTYLARDPFVHVVLTGVEEATAKEGDAAPAVEQTAAEEASITPTPHTEKRNVVLIHLESARAQSMTPYDGDLETTPFLDGIATGSLLAERAYTTVPHTSKAITSVNCGVFPDPSPENVEAEPDGIRARCLADLLGEQGYDSVFFQSPTEDFEDRPDLVSNFGYDEFYALESMDAKGLEQTSYFGPEDDVMLEPSEEWLRSRAPDEPFLATYLTGTGHHDYRCRSTDYGQRTFSEDDWADRYLNCLRLQDIFVENLMDQYKELGLYEETIFVLYGDHGEGLGEHGRYQHNDTAWEEGLKVPLMVHAPGLTDNGPRTTGLANLTDVLPTVLEMLGYELNEGEYPGYSLLREPPEDRILRFSCFHERQCLASIRGYDKYIYHYDNWPEEFFDLAADPLEEINLAEERDKGELAARREDLLVWRSGATPDGDD